MKIMKRLMGIPKAMIEHWKVTLTVLAILTAWMLVPGINKMSPMAWVCPTCVLDNVALGSHIDFDVQLDTNTAISQLNINYYIYGPNAGSTIYTKPIKTGTFSGIPSSLTAGQQIDLVLPIDFDRNVWNAGNDYHLIIEVLDGSAPVGLGKTMYDVTYYNNAACRARVDSMAVDINGQQMTCAVDVATQAECPATWSNGMCCKSVADTYASFCGGVAWSFNIVDYSGSVTVSIGSVRPFFG
jgi:hypothetical protein